MKSKYSKVIKSWYSKSNKTAKKLYLQSKKASKSFYKSAKAFKFRDAVIWYKQTYAAVKAFRFSTVTKWAKSHKKFLAINLLVLLTGFSFIQQWKYHTERYENLLSMMPRIVLSTYFVSCMISSQQTLEAVSEAVGKRVEIPEMEMVFHCKAEAITVTQKFIEAQKNVKKESQEEEAE